MVTSKELLAPAYEKRKVTSSGKPTGGAKATKNVTKRKPRSATKAPKPTSTGRTETDGAKATSKVTKAAKRSKRYVMAVGTALKFLKRHTQADSTCMRRIDRPESVDDLMPILAERCCSWQLLDSDGRVIYSAQTACFALEAQLIRDALSGAWIGSDRANRRKIAEHMPLTARVSHDWKREESDAAGHVDPRQWDRKAVESVYDYLAVVSVGRVGPPDEATKSACEALVAEWEGRV